MVGIIVIIDDSEAGARRAVRDSRFPEDEILLDPEHGVGFGDLWILEVDLEWDTESDFLLGLVG